MHLERHQQMCSDVVQIKLIEYEEQVRSIAALSFSSSLISSGLITKCRANGKEPLQGKTEPQ